MVQAERRSLLTVVGLAAQRGWDEQVWRLSESTGDPLTILRYLDDLATVTEAALAAARHAGDNSAEGRALGTLGMAYRELRRFEAIGCYQQDIAICQETGDRYGEGQTLNNLGNTYQEMRQPGRAARCWREAAMAMRDTGDHEEAGRLEQQAANTQPRRRRWQRRGSRSAGSRPVPR